MIKREKLHTAVNYLMLARASGWDSESKLPVSDAISASLKRPDKVSSTQSSLYTPELHTRYYVGQRPQRRFNLRHSTGILDDEVAIGSYPLWGKGQRMRRGIRRRLVQFQHCGGVALCWPNDKREMEARNKTAEGMVVVAGMEDVREDMTSRTPSPSLARFRCLGSKNRASRAERRTTSFDLFHLKAFTNFYILVINCTNKTQYPLSVHSSYPTIRLLHLVALTRLAP
jgi:hypothetical protein